MRIRTALSTLALATAALAAGAADATADGAPGVTVDNSRDVTLPSVCSSSAFSFVTVPVNLLGESDSSSCRTS
ncbi:hypothetical protein [Streptomyces sp. NPDC005322]|uniref:hypothetical protein n=1 Tax=unclassified Streptomyces TaxID=2593676 RepID=UPI0033AEDBC9